VWVGLTLASHACGGEEPGDSYRPIEVAEELRIGRLDGDAVYTFGAVAAIAPSPNGTVYIADRQARVVRKYDAEGAYLHDVGRSGEGPGEYRSVDGIGVDSAGILHLFDGQNWRLSRFGRSGNFLDSAPIERSWGGARAMVYSRGGDVFLRLYPEEGPAETLDGLRGDWARIGPGSEVERLHVIPSREPVGPRYAIGGPGGPYRPFNTETLSALGPDGSLYSVRNDEYRIVRTRPDGTVSDFGRSEPRVAVGAQEMSEWVTRSERFAARNPGRRAEYSPVPETKPLIKELVVDLDGRLWVSRYTEAVFMEYSPAEREGRASRGLPSQQWRDLSRWDVFDSGDEYMGSVVLPFKTTFMTAEGDVVWGVQAGDFDEPYVVRWRLSTLPSP